MASKPNDLAGKRRGFGSWEWEIRGGGPSVRDECIWRDVIPTAILAVSLPTAVKVIGFMTPTGRETLQRPLPEGMFWVVSISAGGNSYGIMRIPEVPEET